jgi:hypothetical protein
MLKTKHRKAQLNALRLRKLPGGLYSKDRKTKASSLELQKKGEKISFPPNNKKVAKKVVAKDVFINAFADISVEKDNADEFNFQHGVRSKVCLSNSISEEYYYESSEITSDNSDLMDINDHTENSESSTANSPDHSEMEMELPVGPLASQVRTQSSQVRTQASQVRSQPSQVRSHASQIRPHAQYHAVQASETASRESPNTLEWAAMEEQLQLQRSHTRVHLINILDVPYDQTLGHVFYDDPPPLSFTLITHTILVITSDEEQDETAPEG